MTDEIQNIKQHMNKKQIFAAIALVTLAACSKSGENDEQQVPVKITAGLGSPTTRAIDQNWNGDVIGVTVISDTNGTMTNATNTNVEYSTTSTDVTAIFSPVNDNILFNASYKGTASFVAYAPYSSNVTNNQISINTLQNNDTQDNQEKSLDFIFASGATATFANPTVAFEGSNAFVHTMVQLNVAVRTEKTDDLTTDIDDVSEISLGGLIHEGLFNILTGEVTATGDVVSSWDIKNLRYYDDETKHVRTYTLIVIPQTLSEALSLSITIQGKTYTNKSINPNLTKAGRAYNYMITVQGNKGIKVEGSTITKWDLQDYEEGDAYQE
jgi:hypothetical protein